MLRPAKLYEDQVVELQRSIWYDEKYKYWNSSMSYDSIEIKDSTYNEHQFVSVNSDDEVIGYISYNVNRETNNVHTLGVINFSNDSMTFGRDLGQALRDIFEKYHFRKLSFFVVCGNPIESSYDRMISKYGGRIVDTQIDEVRLVDGKYYNVKWYEILGEDYFKSEGYNTILSRKLNKLKKGKK